MLEKFETYLISERRLSDHSIVAYLNDINSFIDFAQWNSETQDLSALLNYKVIRSWVGNLKESGLINKSVNRKLSALRTFAKWGLKHDFIEVNPMLKITSLKQNKRLPEFVKEQDISNAKMEDLFPKGFEGSRDKLIFELLYQTGVRLSELIHLKESDINSQTIKVLGKRNKERIIPINEDMHRLVLEFIQQKKEKDLSCVYLLCTDIGNKLYPKFVYRKINYYLSIVTTMQKKSPHVLRHTFATHMLNNGAGLEAIKEVLGHANLSATQVYTHNSFKEITNIYKRSHPRG